MFEQRFAIHLNALNYQENVLCLGARFIDFEIAKEIIESFLNTDFEGGRHLNRVNKIKAIESVNFKEEF